ncbi:von Willebrand factor A domain-containing protein 3B [Elysia marginata]|uniref:von Willebrand factor A domain-containing protein 3B n=1 Tax=Elysia marginata TaxID=1093978 RepID=A0AAV4EC14_9GAST|nr:von Willebrand factor A domain-containing protein 3B [Elysia marginata]
MYSSECAPVSHDTVQNAIQWLWSLDRLAPVSATAAAEGILRALADQHNEAVYLFTEGTSVDSGKEILMDKVAGSKFKIPVHVVSFNCDCSNNVKFLKQFAKASRGKFHAYAVVMELDAYEAQPASDSLASRANIMLKRKTFGGVPAGAGVREDVILIFEEVEEARNNLAQVRMLIERAPEPKRAPSGVEIEPGRPVSLKDEQYMSSREWLQIYGLDARKLGLYDVLGGVAFKHLDGVIDIMQPPPTDSQTDAIVSQKLINARYCDRFPVVKWRDGRVVHVQVTPDVHRTYEERVQVALNKIQQRIDWLNQGSRALFGTVVEDMIYILIDTSASMQPSLGFVKQKLFVLMQEQLRHKKKFNLVTFNSKAAGWKDRLVEVSERSLQSAWSWVQNLSCWGTTNTYGAIQLAMADPQIQAIYLLTDGRPDQPPKSIIAQVQMQKHIPIHTISFNCNDSDANHFLYGLAEATGGRYHYFSEAGPPVDQPDSWESMDIRILKDEIKKGLENLEKLAGLRDECTRMAWKRETDELRRSIDSARESAANTGRMSAMPPLDSKDLYRPDSEMRPTSPTPPISSPPPRPISSTPPPPRPSSAPPSRSVSVVSPRLLPTPPPNEKPDRPDSAHNSRLRGSGGLPVKLPKRPKSAKVSLRKPLVAGHTRTSMLRTLNSSGRFSPNEWLLPETKSLFQVQAERQKEIAQQREIQEKLRKKKSGKMARASEMSSKQWLSKNGLVAKRLTILDALGSTFIPHKAKYISILDKHVMSKVFDEVLPIAHVSKSQNVRLVNPNGVNLKEYETKVKAAQAKFRKRLDALVWNALPESAKEEFESDKPISFEENRTKILLHLEDANWPVREQDVTLLANEIARADKFLLQSKSLRKAAAGEDDWDESEESSFELPGEKSHAPKKREASSPTRSDKSNDSPRSVAKSNQDEDDDDKGRNSPRRSRSDNGSPVRSEKGSQDFEVSSNKS